MTPFTILEAVAVPLLRANVDTDTIIPSNEIRAVAKTGLSGGLFAPWRYLSGSHRAPDPGFVLNDPAYTGASILMSGENFGCGSSRESAVWALMEWGFRALIAPSFNPIFYRNCLRNGLLPAQIDASIIERIAAWVMHDPQSHRLTVDLRTAELSTPQERWTFHIEAEARAALLEGRDEIARTLEFEEQILAFRARDAQRRPWVYAIAAAGAAEPLDDRKE